MAEHAKFSPSSGSRWLPCPASIQRSEGMPDSASEAAFKGTVYHAIAAAALLASTEEGAPSGDAHSLVQTAAGDVFTDPEKHDCEEEMDELEKIGSEITIADVYEKVEQYVADALVAINGEGVCSYGIEKRVRMKSVHELCWGTSDLYVVYSDTILVTDYKSGQVIVSPKDNPQLMLYAIGVLLGLSPAMRKQITTIELCVHQNNQATTYTIHKQDLIEWNDKLAKAAADADSDNPTVLAGDEQCKYCPARETCPEWAAQGILQAQEDYGSDDGLPAVAQLNLMTIDSETAQRVVEGIRFFDNWKKDALEILTKRAVAGFEIPGSKLIEGKKNKAWIDKKAAAKELKKIPSAFNDPTLRTPTQLIKELESDVVDHLWHQPKGEAKLVAKAAKGKAWEDDSDFPDED